MSGILLRAAPFAIGAVLLAAMVHIVAVLALPRVAIRTAGHLLAAQAGPAGATLLPPESPGAESTPFADPALATALCAFDLAEGPFRIRAQMGESFASLVILSQSGQVLHGLTDKAATRRVLDVVLATDQQLRALEAQDPDDRPTQEIRLRLSAARGVAALRMLSPRPTDMPAVADLLRRTQCGPTGDP